MLREIKEIIIGSVLTLSGAVLMIASVNRGNNGFEGDAGDLCRRYPPRLPARKASSSALPKAPALLQNSKGPLRHLQGQVCKAAGRRLAAASRGRERGKRGFAAAGRRWFPLVYRC